MKLRKPKDFWKLQKAMYIRYMKEDGQPPMDLTEFFVAEEDALLPQQERTKRVVMSFLCGDPLHGGAGTVLSAARVIADLPGRSPSEAACPGE
ncbi:hypothetical protein J4Q44_G00275680 [Coregonus suidteri]|uniref:Uncharacterized protein n=1 Tax=Coregonus suidteri TaxID=861788 RepID=A0AAN8L4Y1_9TELE